MQKQLLFSNGAYLASRFILFAHIVNIPCPHFKIRYLI